MLRIEKVFLQGFKSFCDPTTVLFDEEGITAIVGPNGCGKSNIADAITWVIGKQHPKTLRGGKMEDLIFQGSRNRPPSGLAEVTLTLLVRESFELRSTDNNQPEPISTHPEPALLPPTNARPQKKGQKTDSSSAAQLYQAGERITIARRLFRSGESEYEMNGRPCRLRDIQDLFAGTGLGAAHYAIIEQGRIGQVLSAKPLDRRALIEEAAGISKFKLRQHAAELKLEAAKHNLARITDILSEVERQQASLKRQAARARRFQQLHQEMRQLQRAIFLAEYQKTRAELDALMPKLQAISEREAQCLSLISQREAEQTLYSKEVARIEEQLHQERTLETELTLQLERARQQHEHLTQQLQELQLRATQATSEQSAIQRRSQLIAQESDRLRHSLTQLNLEIEAKQAALLAEEKKHQTQLQLEAEAEQNLEAARQKLYNSATLLERWRQLKRHFTEATSRHQAQLQGLSAEQERAQKQHTEARLCHDKLLSDLEQTATAQCSLQQQLQEVEQSLLSLRQQIDAHSAELASLCNQLSATEHRLRSLQELDRQRAYFSEAVQTLMHHSLQTNSPAAVHSDETAKFHTLGTLSDFVHVAPEHETMIELGLRDELQYILVPSYEDALRALALLKKEEHGCATFLLVNSAPEPAHQLLVSSQPPPRSHNNQEDQGENKAKESSTEPGSSPTLLSILGLPPQLSQALERALPALAQAEIAENVESAIELSLKIGSGGLVLTRTGERITAGQLISGGSQLNKGTGILALKREIAQLTEQVQTLSHKRQQTEDQLHSLKTATQELNTKRATLDHELRHLERQLAVEREQLQAARRELERSATYLRVVETEIAQARQELLQSQDKLQHAGSETADAERLHTENQHLLSAAQESWEQTRRLAEESRELLARRRADLAALSERRRSLLERLHRLESEAQELHTRLSHNETQALTYTSQAEAIKGSLTETAEKIRSYTAKQATQAAELEKITTRLEVARQHMAELDKLLRQLRAEATSQREERAQLEIERTRISSHLDHLADSCYRELGQHIEELAHQLSGPQETMQDCDLLAAKAALEQLRLKIANLGPINMMALQELEQIQQRSRFLSRQKADLQQAIDDTQAAIAEIKRRSRDRFLQAFTAINANFSHIFQELFGGGHAEMKLIDETQVLESGLDVIAQPPGKRLQNVLLLSGGEKAMAALALVLAIFKYRPSPFCILDEVDAPLDDLNLSRFSDKLLQMSQQTQFILITHNKRTMEVARTLYGVTMEDPGVSKLVSVRLK
jgi:chromosome segregation protein